MTLLKPQKNLDDWLDYIQSLHSKAIVMGLERVAVVAKKLRLQPNSQANFSIITVAGTNGKGSTCAMLERIYVEAGYRVGCYTSPHLLRYNERVRVNGVEVTDEDLCAAFAAVEAARGDILLTYFEIGTLAAMWHFIHGVGNSLVSTSPDNSSTVNLSNFKKTSALDLVILEVGLGGRLDAVNIFDPACAIVTSVDLDHMDFLGDTRELIGYEKAGIYRKGLPAICGDLHAPLSLVQYAREISADLMLIGDDCSVDCLVDRSAEFSATATSAGWNFNNTAGEVLHLPKPALIGDFQLSNAACVIQAISCLQQVLPVSHNSMQLGLKNVSLKGRFQGAKYNDNQQPTVILDVAHNPQAALALAQNLKQSPCTGSTIAVLAMLADKDMSGVIDAVFADIDTWYVASIDHVRGAKATQLASFIEAHVATKKSAVIPIKLFKNVADAYTQACLDRLENDRIIVFGSFFTVADIMPMLE